jgi:hypothetical protein
LLALLTSLFLERGSRPDRGIESHIIGFSIRRAGLDVPPAFTLCMGTRPAPGVLAG